ncbi:703_t:CDS:1 [Racocetra fulgida]|uniref:703_t:CDS:1 n=1 Tax=Racocetra fulgida TaxID=60492 RepID=A0A9N9BQA2_9GLOM|nr:703_t:CDS:1 [Racocetra fulgida]
MTSPDDKTCMKIVSNTAFRMWTCENEIKQVYIKVSKIAKAVHAFMWPDYKYQPNRKKRLQNSFRYDPYIPVPFYDSQPAQNFSYPNNFVSFTNKYIPHIQQLDISLTKLNYYNDRILCQSVDRHVKI